jgi:hypothetical protein
MTTLVAETIYLQKKTEDEALRSRKMIAVDEMGLEIISLKDVKNLSNVIATASAEILGAEGSMLRIKAEDDESFHTLGSFGLEEGSVREYFLPIERETLQEVFRRKEIISREFSEEASPYIRGVLSCPVVINGRVAGLLTLFNKIEEETFYPCGFSKSDVEVISRFIVYVEKALVKFMDKIRAMPNKDEIAASRDLLEKRVYEELNRARRFEKRLILATLSVGNNHKGAGYFSDEPAKELYAFLQNKTRNFDTVEMLDGGILGVLFAETDEKVMKVLSKSIDAAGLEKLKKEGIYYGYATYPEDGHTFEELFSKASMRVKLDLSKAS